MIHSMAKPKYYFLSSELKLDLLVGPCLSYTSTLMLEAIYSSETSGILLIMQTRSPDHSSLHDYSCDNLK
jgi:hypothetical protein